VSLFDSLVEPPVPVNPPGAEPLGRGTPLEAVTKGLGLGDAIDEILRSQPTDTAASRPISDLPAPANVAMPPPGLKSLARTQVGLAPDGQPIGQIPAAPPPLHAAPPAGGGAGSAELAALVEAPTIAPPKPRMPPANPLTTTMAMDRPPAGGAGAPTALDRAVPPATASSTAIMPIYAPPAPPGGAVGSAPPASPVVDAAPVALPVMPAAAPSVAPAAMKEWASLGPVQVKEANTRSNAPAIIVLVVLALAGVVGGVVAFFRYEASETDSPLPTTLPPMPAPRPSLSTSASASASAEAATEAGIPSTAPSDSAAPAASEAASPSPVGSASASASAAASASAVPSASVAPSASAAPASAAKPSAAVAEGMGIVTTSGAAPGRRIFVDDRTVGQTPQSITVKCGSHSVRIGSSGKTQTIDVPCGGEVGVSDKL
jgi:serine/threonine-protein kinase